MNIKGFTLVELSIVLVIIGLIVAGVTAGQSLVRQAKLRSMSSEIETYKVAYNTFKLEYDAVPGDMPNAYDYWGASVGCTNNDINTTAGGCNGDGNKRIGFSFYDTATNRKEEYKAVQFLAVSGLLPGSYSGDRLNAISIGTNIPKSSAFNNVGISFQYAIYTLKYTADNIVNIPPSAVGIHSSVVMLGSKSIEATYSHVTNFLKTKEALSLDSKMDDGMPNTGRIIGVSGAPIVAGAVTDYCQAGGDIFTKTAAYDLSHETTSCIILGLI